MLKQKKPFHGIIAAGNSIDQVMGLTEAVEMTAEIYVKTMELSRSPRVVTDKQLLEIAEQFEVSPRKGMLEES